MFKFFKRRTDKPSVMYGIFQKLGMVAERRQRRVADFLNKKAAALTRKHLVWGLVLFCLVYGSSSAYMIYHSVQSPSGGIRMQQLTVPNHAILQEHEQPRAAYLAVQELERLRSFRHFLDSLQQTETGRAIYDSFTRYRPGLLDSLAFIERAYQLQIKQSENGKKK